METKQKKKDHGTKTWGRKETFENGTTDKGGREGGKTMGGEGSKSAIGTIGA